MSFSGQSGLIAFGPQSAKGVAAATFYQFAATDIDFDAISPGGILPPEIAGVLTPRGAYKMGVFAAGGFSFIPRLDGDLGWLLLGLFGEVESVPAFANTIVDWITFDSDYGPDSDNAIFTQPPTPRKVAIFAEDSDVGSTLALTITGLGVTGLAQTEVITFASSTAGVAGLEVFSQVDTIAVSVNDSDVDGTKIALGWLATDAVDMACLPWSDGDIDQVDFVDSDLTNPPSARTLVMSFADAAGGNLTADFVVAGTDALGNSVSETFAFAAATSVVGTQVFATLTTITGDSDLDSGEEIALGYATQEAYEHFFTYATLQEQIDWAQIRKVVPGDTILYLEALDAKIAMMRFIIPQAGPAAARVDMVGRVPSWPDGSAWAYDPFDDPDAFPVANAPGYFRFTDVDNLINSLGVTGMVFEIINLLTTPQEEMTVGSNFPDDFGVRGRAVTARFVYRWKDPELCLAIMTGEIDGSSWTAEVFTTDLEAAITTPGAMGDDQEDPWQIKFIAPKCEFRQNGPVRLVGNQTIAVEYIGSVLTPEGVGSPAWSGGGEYFAVALRNEEVSYVWPT